MGLGKREIVPAVRQEEAGDWSGETCVFQKVPAEAWMHVPFEWKTLLSPFLHCHLKTKMLGVTIFHFLSA